MGLFKDDPPTPPNPIATAGAQTGTNVSTSVANAFLNNTNQITPQGALYYDPTGSYSWTDPTTGQSYNIPRFTATQVLSPQQQNIQQLGTQSETNLAQMAANQTGSLVNWLSQPFNINGAPGAGDWTTLYGGPGIQSSYNTAGSQQGTFADAGDVTRSYGPGDYSADRDKVEQALYQRMDPQLQRDRQALEARMADQGIKYGSPAYQAAMDDFNRQLTDTRLGITQTAGQEQQRMQEMANAQATFQNAAQQQAFGQAQSRGTFANQAQAQNYQQNAMAAQFNNSAALAQAQRNQQIIDAQNQARQQWLQEQYQLRNQPINEVTALMSGSQVQAPNYVNTPKSNIPTTDIAGLINNNFNQQLSNYQQSSQNFNSLMGGIFGMMGGLLKSDRDEKENIHRIGTVFAASAVSDADHDEPGRPVIHGVADVDSDETKRRLPIYSYSYKDDPASTRHIGPMAQDVEKVDPGAVHTRKGVKYIEPSRVMGSILRAA